MEGRNSVNHAALGYLVQAIKKGQSKQPVADILAYGTVTFASAELSAHRAKVQELIVKRVSMGFGLERSPFSQ